MLKKKKKERYREKTVSRGTINKGETVRSEENKTMPEKSEKNSVTKKSGRKIEKQYQKRNSGRREKQ